MTTKYDRTVTVFFQGVRALNGTAAQVRNVPARALRPNGRQATEYLRELEKLEQTIRQLKAQITEEPSEQQEVAESAHGKPARPVALNPPESVLHKLGQMAHKRELLASAEFISQLGWSRQALSKALAINRVFYVDFRGERYFPAFYADPSHQRAQLEAVTKVLGELPGGAKLQFFLTRKGSLGGSTPLEALAQGRLQKVKDVAAAFADDR